MKAAHLDYDKHIADQKAIKSAKVLAEVLTAQDLANKVIAA